MSYKNNKFSLYQTNTPSSQTISTTYVEIENSKCEVITNSSTPDLIYRFSFYARDSSTKHIFLNIKLQKSNDDFVSNIVDVEGQNFTISGDTNSSTGSEEYALLVSCFFIVENFDSQHLRVVCRSYSSAWEAVLHNLDKYDGTTGNTGIYYDTNLIVNEL